MTRAYNTAITQQSSGGPVPPITAGKNFIVNGGFDVWQRGTSFASPSNAYTADRFAATPSGSVSYTVSQQPSFLTSSRFCLRVQRNSGQTATVGIFLGMAFETADVIRMQGRTMTWSFYVRAGSNFSPAGGGIGVQLNYGTGTDQGPFVGHTGEVTLVSAAPAITTTGTRYSYTFVVPTNATSMRWNIAMSPTGTAGANDFYDIADMQLEVGSVATPFSRAGGTIQGETAACQRYFQRYGTGAASFYVFGGLTRFTDGAYFGSTAAHQNFVFPVPMRTTPTMSTTGTWKGFGNGNHDGVGTLSIQFGNNQGVFIRFEKSSGSWNSDSCFVQSNDGGYVNLSSEL